MSKNLSMITKNIGRKLKKHSPEILTGIGIAGMISATVMAVRATPKALQNIEHEKKEQNVTKLPLIEMAKCTWKSYIPSAVTIIVSSVCLVGASTVSFKRNTALATAYAMTEATLKSYQEKVVETIGEKKADAIKTKVVKEKMDSNPINNKEVIITTKGDTLCYDSVSGRYFKSDIDTIKKIVNELNRRMLSETYISLNDFYYELGLSFTKMGDQLGWNIDRGLIDISYVPLLADDGNPCLAMEYTVSPEYDYC